MKVSLWEYWTLGACLSLLPIALFAQSSDLAQNLVDCKNGRETCDRSKLSQSESADVARANHARNVSNCRSGFAACDHSQLTRQEAIAWAIADHQRNVSKCKDGIESCDQSK